MKKQEGKTTAFALCYGGEVQRIFDRKIFADRKLYPGISWKYAHFILFGYYPKDWEDMLTFTSSDDPRFDSEYDKSLSLKYLEDDDFEFDDYDYVYEAIKFIMEEEPEYIDENIHKKCIGKKYYSKFAYGRLSALDSAATSLNISLDYLDKAPKEEKKYRIMGMEKDFGHFPKDSSDYCGYIESVFAYYMYRKMITQKNPAEEAKVNTKAKDALKGKTTAFKCVCVEGTRIFDRKIFADRKLYPGRSWKYAHYILFGYYPKDWEDMLTFTSNNDPRFDRSANKDLSLKYLEDDDFDFDDYDYVYEAIKFIMEEEPSYIDESIHQKCVDKNYYTNFAYGRISSLYAAATSLDISLDYLDKSPEEEKKYRMIDMEKKFGHLPKDSSVYFGYVESILAHYMYRKMITQKNLAEEAAKKKANTKAKEVLKEGKFTKYLNIKTKLYSDEVIKTITESFNKAVVFAFNEADKQGKDFFQVVENAVKYGNFRLSDINEDISKFILENDNIVFIFCKNSVGVRLK